MGIFYKISLYGLGKRLYAGFLVVGYKTVSKPDPPQLFKQFPCPFICRCAVRDNGIINIKKNLDFPMLEPDGLDGLAFCTKTLGTKDGVSEMLSELKRETFAKHGAFTVGEVFNITDDDLSDFIGENGYFSTIFDFSTELLSAGEHG